MFGFATTCSEQTLILNIHIHLYVGSRASAVFLSISIKKRFCLAMFRGKTLFSAFFQAKKFVRATNYEISKQKFGKFLSLSMHCVEPFMCTTLLISYNRFFSRGNPLINDSSIFLSEHYHVDKNKSLNCGTNNWLNT